jgi:hypothetical protein
VELAGALGLVAVPVLDDELGLAAFGVKSSIASSSGSITTA